MTRYRLLFSPYTPVHSTNKTDTHDITEILLKIALNMLDDHNNDINQRCINKDTHAHVHTNAHTHTS